MSAWRGYPIIRKVVRDRHRSDRARRRISLLVVALALVIIVSSFSSSPPRPHDLTIAPFSSRCCSCPLIEGGGGGGGDEDDDEDVTTTSTWTIARLKVNDLQRNATTATVLKTSDTHCRRFSQSPAVGPQVWDVRECVCVGVCMRCACVCVVTSSWITRVCGDSFT